METKYPPKLSEGCYYLVTCKPTRKHPEYCVGQILWKYTEDTIMYTHFGDKTRRDSVGRGVKLVVGVHTLRKISENQYICLLSLFTNFKP